MARPAHERVGNAFRLAMETAGLRQGDVAEALGVDPATVSRWSRGMQRIDLDVFPLIDDLCERPHGYVLRLAGYVDDETPDVLTAIDADTSISEDAKQGLRLLYLVSQAESGARPRGRSVHTPG